jgi:hypothetical protein
MKRKLVHVFVVAAMLSATSCYKDDIDGLQKKVDELEQKVSENTKTIQEQILNQISSLQNDIKTLQSEDENLNKELEDVNDDLTEIKDDVADNSDAVFYGNLVSDADYAAYKEAGADVVTGKVYITTIEQAAIVSNCRWIGSDLITEVGNLEGILNIGGDLIMNSDGETIILKDLVSIGGDFDIPLNDDLRTITANELVVINGKLSLKDGLKNLRTLSMHSLELVGSVYLNGDNTAADTGKTNLDLDWNSPLIAGDLHITKIDNIETSVGSVYGDVTIDYNDINTFKFEGTELKGDFVFTYNSTETILASSVLTMGGNVNIESNIPTGGTTPGSVQGAGPGLTEMDFSNLGVINGDVLLKKNDYLTGIFNNVSTVEGDITFEKGNMKLDYIVFENLENVKKVTFNMFSAKSLKGFNSVENSKDIFIVGSYKIEGDIEIFNSLVNIEQYNITVSLPHYRFGSLNLSNSFTSLESVNNIKIKSYAVGTKYYESFIEAGAFPNLNVCKSLTFDGKVSYNEGFAKLTTISTSLTLSNGALDLSLPAVTNIGQFISVFVRNNGDNVNISLPELETSKSIIINGYESAGVVSLDLPKLKTLEQFLYRNYVKTGGGAVATRIDAPMPSLTAITKLDLNFKTGIVNTENLLTQLTTLVDAGYVTKVYLQYVSGQKFCSLSNFLNGIDLEKLGKKVTLKEDGNILDDATAIKEVTTCNE